MTLEADTRERVLNYARHQASKGLGELSALMERTGADCARCLEGVSEAQAEFKAEGEWSIKEVLGHVLDSTTAVNNDVARLARGEPGRPIGRLGVTVGAERPIEEMRRALAELWSETARLVASLPEEGSLEAKREHPWFGALNFREWIAFQRLHAMDHVQQIEKVKSHPDYPKG